MTEWTWAQFGKVTAKVLTDRQLIALVASGHGQHIQVQRLLLAMTRVVAEGL